MVDRLTAKINRPGMLTRKRDIVLLAGYFEPNDTTSPTVIKCPGVTSVTYAGNAFTVTLDDSYKDISVQASLQLHTASTDATIVLGDFVAGTGSAGNSFKIAMRKSSDASATTIAAVTGVAGNRIHLLITCARKSDFGTVTD